MALNQWFKFYGGEYLSDPKIASLSPAKRSCWITILALASISSEPGTVEYLTVEVLLEKSGIKFDPYDMTEWNSCLGVLEEFVRMKMITKSDDGVIEIVNWIKRQETALTNAERQAKYRENRKNNENITGDITEITLDKIREDKNTSVANAPRFAGETDEDQPKPKSQPKYPHSKEVFSWFPTPEPSWKLDTTQLKHAELLFLRGEKKVRSILAFCKKHSGEEYLPGYRTPVMLERNWEKIIAFADRNGL